MAIDYNAFKASTHVRKPEAIMIEGGYEFQNRQTLDDGGEVSASGVDTCTSKESV